MAMQPQCLTAFNETDPLRFTGTSEQQSSYLKRHTPRVPTFPPFPSPSYPPFIFLMLPSFHYQLHGVFNTPLTNKANVFLPMRPSFTEFTAQLLRKKFIQGAIFTHNCITVCFFMYGDLNGFDMMMCRALRGQIKSAYICTEREKLLQLQLCFLKDFSWFACSFDSSCFPPSCCVSPWRATWSHTWTTIWSCFTME